MTPKEIIAASISLHVDGKIDKSLDMIYSGLGDLLLAKNYIEVDSLLLGVPTTNIDLVLAILIVTRPYKVMLPNRNVFLNFSKEYFKNKEAPDLFDNL